MQPRAGQLDDKGGSCARARAVGCGAVWVGDAQQHCPINVSHHSSPSTVFLDCLCVLGICVWSGHSLGGCIEAVLYIIPVSEGSHAFAPPAHAAASCFGELQSAPLTLGRALGKESMATHSYFLVYLQMHLRMNTGPPFLVFDFSSQPYSISLVGHPPHL